MKKLLSIVFLSVFFAGFAQAADTVGYQEGTEYRKTDMPIDIAPAKKSVIEIFGYHCPHCYHLEDSLEAWVKTKPADVNFEQVPAVFNSPNWIFMAKVFYTAKVLGVLEKSHRAYFDALHRDHKQLFDVDSIAKFFTQFGVKEQDFKDTFNSFKVEQLLRRAQDITARSGIDGVPAVVVNGKARTDVGMAGSRDKLWILVNHLTEQ